MDPLDQAEQVGIEPVWQSQRDADPRGAGRTTTLGWRHTRRFGCDSALSARISRLTRPTPHIHRRRQAQEMAGTRAPSLSRYSFVRDRSTTTPGHPPKAPKFVQGPSVTSRAYFPAVSDASP